ncbi:PilZ domain-containing protein [Paenibacillus sp.]|uniref:PilZ domain-containing protein n=1 Tax=Paenibacillus sp. TaxID=58172 RepID=UPI002810DE76|nr:PilZ domain-containing protein [Paenibacillus sp.]
MSFMRATEILHHQKNAITIGSRVSVEKDAYISTGVVSYIEGDILEIEMPQSKMYKPGDPVKLTVYSSNGFLILPSSVLAKDTGILMVLNPPENQLLSTRRQFPRIEVSDSGRMRSLRWSNGGENKLDASTAIDIRNVSLGGIGFTLDVDPGTRAMMVADVELDINGGVPCKIEISRKQTTEDGSTYIGARFLEIEPEHLNALRGYILRTQIKHRAKQRLEEATAM